MRVALTRTEEGRKAQDDLGDSLSRYRRMTGAIDPGKSGGIAYRDTDGSVHAVPMPDTVADLDRLLRVLVCPETVCFIKDLPMYRGKMNLRSPSGRADCFPCCDYSTAALFISVIKGVGNLLWPSHTLSARRCS
jgi:hypothetical protein